MEELRPYSDGARVDVTFNDDAWRRNMYTFHDPSLRREEKMSVSKPCSWWNDPEAKRMRRIAKYKLYTTEGKLKISLKRSLRWLKIKCIAFVTTL